MLKLLNQDVDSMILSCNLMAWLAAFGKTFLAGINLKSLRTHERPVVTGSLHVVGVDQIGGVADWEMLYAG